MLGPKLRSNLVRGIERVVFHVLNAPTDEARVRAASVTLTAKTGALQAEGQTPKIGEALPPGVPVDGAADTQDVLPTVLGLGVYGRWIGHELRALILCVWPTALWIRTRVTSAGRDATGLVYIE